MERPLISTMNLDAFPAGTDHDDGAHDPLVLNRFDFDLAMASARRRWRRFAALGGAFRLLHGLREGGERMIDGGSMPCCRGVCFPNDGSPFKEAFHRL